MGMQLRLLYGGIPCPQNGILKPHNYGETQIMPFGKGLVLVGVSYPVIHRISYRMGITISLSPWLPLVAVTRLAQPQVVCRLKEVHMLRS